MRPHVFIGIQHIRLSAFRAGSFGKSKKMKLVYFVVTMALCASFLCCTSFQQAEEDKALSFLAKFNNDTPYEDFKDAVARWKYATNITEHNKQLTADATITFSSFQNQMRLEASKFKLTLKSSNQTPNVKFCLSLQRRRLRINHSCGN